MSHFELYVLQWIKSLHYPSKRNEHFENAVYQGHPTMKLFIYPRYDSSLSRGDDIIAFSVTFVILAVITVALRFYTELGITHSTSADDWIILASLVSRIGFCGLWFYELIRQLNVYIIDISDYYDHCYRDWYVLAFVQVHLLKFSNKLLYRSFLWYRKAYSSYKNW